MAILTGLRSAVTRRLHPPHHAPAANADSPRCADTARRAIAARQAEPVAPIDPLIAMEQEFGVRCFGQEGEDMVLRRLFETPPVPDPGFYVDVGAHHPLRFSNTYLFYQRGWRGINIDAMPGSMAAFDRLRPRDMNIEMGIAESAGSLDYYMFNEPALNGFSRELSNQRDGFRIYRLLETRRIPVLPLRDVLDRHLPEGQTIDFLSIDVEGLDEVVIRSNDWDRFRPRYLLVEALGGDSLAGTLDSETAAYLATQGYQPRCRTASTLFFQDERRSGVDAPHA